MSSFRRLLSLTSVRVYHSQTLVQSRSLGGVWRGTAVRGTAVGIRSLWSARGGLHNRSSQGKKLWTESFLGLSFTALLVKYRPVVVWAMDEEDYEDMLESDSGYLDVDPCSFLAFTLKLEMPIFFLVTLVMGWAYPITIAIHAVIFLFCTRPSPYSIYVILEQFRRSAMRQDPGFYKSKVITSPENSKCFFPF